MDSRLLTILLFEFRSAVRRRGYQIMTAAFPLVGAILLLLARIIGAGGGEATPSPRGYVDLWGRLPSEAPLETGLRAYASEERARNALLAGQIESYFVIPADYIEMGLVHQYATSEGDLLGDTFGPAVLRALLIQALVVDQVGAEIAMRVQLPLQIERVRLTLEGPAAPVGRDGFTRFLIPYAFSVLLMTSIFMASGLLIQSVTEEKQSRTIEVLLSSVSAFTLMAGKLLGLGIAGLLQVLVWLISAPFLAALAGRLLPLPGSLQVPPDMVAVGVLFFLLGYLFFGTLQSAVGAMATTPQEGAQLGGLLSMLVASPLFFIVPILDDPSGTVARAFTFIPFTSPITVMLRLSSASPPWLEIALGALLLALSTAGALFLAARIFRAYLLLYGRRPSLREVWRTLRAAE